MIEAVFIGTLVPLVFLILAVRGETRLLLGFFAWGIVAFSLALTVNTKVYELTGLSEEYLSVTWAPIVEEFCKALPLICFLFIKKDVRYPIIYFAMAAGIGFSIQENYLYLLDNYGGATPVMFIVIRSVTTCLMHGMSVAVIGCGVQIVRRIRLLMLPVIFGLFTLAVTLHALYNLYIDSSVRLIGLLMPIFLYLSAMLAVKDEPKKENDHVPQGQN